jgi:hypothetical protein
MLPPALTSRAWTVPSLPINSTITRHFIPLSRSAAASRLHTTPTFETVSRLQVIIDLLLAHPNIGTRTDGPTIRRMTAPLHPYLFMRRLTPELSWLMPLLRWNGTTNDGDLLIREIN